MNRYIKKLFLVAAGILALLSAQIKANTLQTTTEEEYVTEGPDDLVTTEEEYVTDGPDLLVMTEKEYVTEGPDHLVTTKEYVTEGPDHLVTTEEEYVTEGPDHLVTTKEEYVTEGAGLFPVTTKKEYVANGANPLSKTARNEYTAYAALAYQVSDLKVSLKKRRMRGNSDFVKTSSLWPTGSSQLPGESAETNVMLAEVIPLKAKEEAKPSKE
ncbi:uncharacterized protein [Heptranchias perlo]|uniref:uncharacterized protein n=1 Tax=Heptranchias perlo TaxID=212740 RepID=UPI00355A984E